MKSSDAMTITVGPKGCLGLPKGCLGGFEFERDALNDVDAPKGCFDAAKGMLRRCCVWGAPRLVTKYSISAEEACGIPGVRTSALWDRVTSA